MTRRISSSRPMTGSILPARAASVRSRPYFSSAWYCSSGFWLVTRWLPRTCCERGQQLLAADAEAVGQGQQQVLGGEVLVVQLGAGRVGLRRAARSAPGRCGARRRRPWAAGRPPPRPRCAAASGACRPSGGWAARRPPPGRAGPASRWSGVTSGLLLARASSTAALNASWVFRVQRFGSRAMAGLLRVRCGRVSSRKVDGQCINFGGLVHRRHRTS